jgi:hypothetical protein
MSGWKWEQVDDWQWCGRAGDWHVVANSNAFGRWYVAVVQPAASNGHSGFDTLEEAQRAAEAMVATLVAPFVEAEREAIRAEIERQQRENAGKSWERCFNFADLLEWLDARKDGAK